MNIEQSIINYLKNLDSRLKTIFISVIVWALIAHGIAFFNITSYHDDANNLFGIGWTYGLGRWGLALTGDFVTYFFGKAGDTGHLSLRLIAGFSAVFFISAVVWCIVKLLDIKSTIGSILLAGIFITCPMISSLLGYTFTVFYYMFSAFLAILGAYLVCHTKKWYKTLFGMVAICWSIGIYQAFFPLAASLILLNYIKETNDDVIVSWKKFTLRGLYYFLVIVFSMLLYFAMTKLSTLWSHVGLADYKGVSNMGKDGLMVYIKRIGLAYNYFFCPMKIANDMKLKTIFPMNTYIIYQFFVYFTTALTFLHIGKLSYTNKIKALQFLILVIFLPLSINFIFIMCPVETLSTLMVYGSTMFFVFSLYLIEKLTIKEKPLNLIFIVNFIGLLILNIMYCRFDNFIATKSIFIQERTFSYFTTLIANIKGTPNYKDEYPVVFLNQRKIKDLNIHDINFPKIIVAGQYHQHQVNSYSWLKFIENWCAYSPRLGNASDFVNLSEVKEMPHYPDYGSIKVINETVVVKF